jgi:hypothetical protein
MATTSSTATGGPNVSSASGSPTSGAGHAPAMVYHPAGAMVAPGVVPYMAAPRAPTPAAEVVGNSFVNQFYTILHTSPAVLYRFYTNDSTLIVSGEHGEESDAPTTYRTQRDIHNKVMSMGYDETQADIKSIDASHTLGGGVLVQVTGALRRKGENFARNFVQSFLLAPQENGFFVLNDIVRYLDKVNVSATKTKTNAAQGAKQAAPAVKAETKAVKAGKGKDGDDEAESKTVESAKEKTSDDSKKAAAAAESDSSKPRTYAMMAAAAAAAAAAASGESNVSTAKSKPAAAAAAAAPAAAAAAPAKTEQQANVSQLGCGIFIKNIFIDTTVEDLEKEFGRFGVIRGGAKGINLKPPKLQHETKFAFIDFDEPAAATAALEAQIELHGKSLVVEMKKASLAPNAKGATSNGKRESKGRNGEGGGERKNGSKNGRQQKKTESAEPSK